MKDTENTIIVAWHSLFYTLFCGILTEDVEGFHFTYDATYLLRDDAKALSPTMPL